MPAKSAVSLARSMLSRGKDVILLGSSSELDVSLVSERSLKALAARKERWLLTPHCFAHRFRPGRLGLLGTAGTAIQHAGCLLHSRNVGLSRVFSVGARDLSNSIGGVSTFQALRWLEQDAGTDAILLLLKPIPGKQWPRLAGRLRRLTKPVVAYVFGGSNPSAREQLNRVIWACTLEDAVFQVEALMKGIDITPLTPRPKKVLRRELPPASLPLKHRIYGLFSGGSCCDEVVSFLLKSGLKVRTNSVLGSAAPRGWWEPEGHVSLDLGSPIAADTRPHYAMTDLSRKVELLKRIAMNSKASVVVFDVFLGYGSHSQPAQEIAAAIREARGLARMSGNQICFVGTVVGVDTDPQGLAKQTAIMRRAGVYLTETVTAAARRAIYLAGRST